MFKLLGAVYLGWALGANDAANVFGPAVSSRAVRYRTAILIAATLVLLGAFLGGRRTLAAVSAIGAQTPDSALLVSLSAALAMSGLIALRMPASSSQAVLGAIVGGGLARGTALDSSGIQRLVWGWILTPIVASLVALVLYVLLATFSKLRLSAGLLTLDRLVRVALVAAGAWGAYALGANNAANVTGVFVASGTLQPQTAALLAGVAIGFGILTFGQRLMYLVGRDLVRLEPPTALVTMLAQAITVHWFALTGIPVSTSQALAGGALGIGVVKGVRTINRRALLNILLGWVATPLSGGALAFAGVRLLQILKPL